MKKMNRREYLISMGAAGLTAGTAKLDVFAQHGRKPQGRSRSTQREATSTTVEQSEVVNSAMPTTESVKLVFYGLIAFWRNVDEHCEVGFHSKASGKHQHQLMVNAFRKEPNGDCTKLLADPKLVKPGDKLDLEIIRPDVLEGVYFFQPPMTAGRMHDNDFRWVVNLEDKMWYGEVLTKKPVHDPILKVRNGLFYTLMKTPSTFRRQKANGTEPLYIGHVAEYVAANIYLESGGHVTLSLPGLPPIKMAEAENVKYEVHFTNYCRKKGTNDTCEFNGYHPDKTERSDFYMHFDAINLPAHEEFELVVAQGALGNGPQLCGPTRGSDESPCSAYGYGGPGGFPSFP